MLFNSPLFLLYFFPAFYACYLAATRAWKNAVALAGSVVFYAWGAPTFLLILVISALADYMLATRLRSGQPSTRRWLWLGVGYNLLTLGVFKYFNFFVDNARVLFESIGWQAPPYLEWALPIGISFFTFQKISFLVDVYRGDAERPRSFADYALFVVLFPQLIAGPIVRYHEMSGQIRDRSAQDTWSMRWNGFVRLTVGLAKKVLVADVLATFVDPVFAANDAAGFTAWLALIAYGLQIYVDFSAYSDMAIGLGGMLGFQFPENFDRPYRSRGFREFWRRWHMSLSTFMRDYLYIPLGGNRGSQGAVMARLWVVFLLSGLWHGASWNFVIWGVWHGLFIAIEHRWSWWRTMPSVLAVFLTFLAVQVGWVWFRTDTLAEAWRFLGGLMSVNIVDVSMSRYQAIAFVIALAGAWVPATWFPVPKAPWWFWVQVALIWVLFLLVLGKMSDDLARPFIYFRF